MKVNTVKAQAPGGYESGATLQVAFQGIVVHQGRQHAVRHQAEDCGQAHDDRAFSIVHWQFKPSETDEHATLGICGHFLFCGSPMRS